MAGYRHESYESNYEQVMLRNKVRVLHDNHWSDEEIAREVRISPSSVRYILETGALTDGIVDLV